MPETKSRSDWVADLVLQTLQLAPGLSPRGIRLALSRDWNSGRVRYAVCTADEIGQALDWLHARGEVRMVRQKTGGRRGKLWVAVD